MRTGIASARIIKERVKDVVRGAGVGALGGALNAPVGGVIGGAMSGDRKPGETKEEYAKRYFRNFARGAALTFGAQTALGAGVGAASRGLRKRQAYAWRQGHWGKPPKNPRTQYEARKARAHSEARQSRARGGYAGYQRRERWDPKTGRGFAGGGGKPGAGPSKAEKILSSVEESKRKRARDLARMARDQGSPNEAANAKRLLDRMAKQYGFSASELMKHAAWVEGVRMGMRNA